MLVCPLCEQAFPPGFAERCPDDGTLLHALGADGPPALYAPGTTIAGKFELIEELERRGGAGRTFRARQLNLDRLVELRVLPNDTLTRPVDHARFQREVATWARLRSDYVVRLYDSGFTETNAPYMALEAVPGGSLGVRLREQGQLPIDVVETAAEQVLQALAAAHEAAVLHRDLTPDAIVLTRRADGSVHCRLTGFGLAKHLGEGDEDPTAITMTGHVVGNPAYMAPETILQGILDPRTDLYALGVTLYELTAGRRPFPGNNTLADMLHAHVQGRTDPLDRHRPDAPLGLRRFIERLIARVPEERYQTAEQALNALRSSLAAWPDPPAMAIPVGRPAERVKKPAKSPQRRQYLLWGVAGVGAILLGILLGVLIRR